MGRKSALTDKQKSDLAKKIDDEGITEVLNNLKNDEKSVITQLKIMLLGGDLAKALDVAKFSRYKFEFNVKSGRVDMALFHCDGGISLVEAKAHADANHIASAIGQLFIYETSLRSMMQEAPPKYINKIICTPMNDRFDEIGYASCQNAGIKYFRLESYANFEAYISRMKKNINNG